MPPPLGSLLDSLFEVYLFILFGAVMGLHLCAGFVLAAVSAGYCPVALCVLLIMVASFAAEHRL